MWLNGNSKPHVLDPQGPTSSATSIQGGKRLPGLKMGNIYTGQTDEHTQNSLQTIEGCVQCSVQSRVHGGTASDFQGGGDRVPCGRGHDALLPGLSWRGGCLPANLTQPGSEESNCGKAVRAATVWLQARPRRGGHSREGEF